MHAIFQWYIFYECCYCHLYIPTMLKVFRVNYTYIWLQAEAGRQNLPIGLVSRDMQVVGCLIAELCLSTRLRVLGPRASLIDRCTLAYQLCTSALQDVPR